MATDLDWLKALVQLMNQNDLAELSLEEDGRKVRLRKHGPLDQPAGGGPAQVMAAMGSATAARPGAKQAPKPALQSAAAGTAEGQADLVEIHSPMVGTFYRANSPEAAPYVEVGDSVKEDTTLCIIEAMKVMNEIKAEMEGVLQEILVSNGEAVEYGQPLFIVKRPK